MKKFFWVLSFGAALSFAAGCGDGSMDDATATSEEATNQSTLSETNSALPGPTATPAVPTPAPAQPQ